MFVIPEGYINSPEIYLLLVMTLLPLFQHTTAAILGVHNTTPPKILFQMVLLSSRSHSKIINSEIAVLNKL